MVTPPGRPQEADQTSDDLKEQQIIENIKSLWTGDEKFLLSRNPDGRAQKENFCDVRDIVQGLMLGIEKDAAIGEEFTLGGAAIFDREKIIPYLSERYKLGYVDAKVLQPNYFEFDPHSSVTSTGDI